MDGKTAKFNNSFSVIDQTGPILSTMSSHIAVRVYIVAGLLNTSAFV
ncbi:unnamed protein product [Cuscuta europaea]|uniref:Uncharacterized protein n=1 Tax=Cuscuta europaea TaxID=41803 RepID=A0A9P0YR10_CUSEU|nr:unnamed protein product [Cuscuta europaea]